MLKLRILVETPKASACRPGRKERLVESIITYTVDWFAAQCSWFFLVDRRRNDTPSVAEHRRQHRHSKLKNGDVCVYTHEPNYVCSVLRVVTILPWWISMSKNTASPRPACGDRIENH
jgi:hypothetical protein